MSGNALWTSTVISEIRTRSETGSYLVRGFGANRPLPGLDRLMLLPAQLHGSPAVDKYREEIKIRTVIGEQLKRPLVLDTPVFVPAMSFGALGREAKTAVARAVAQLGTATNTGEGGGLPEERDACHEGEGKLVAQWSTGRFGVDLEYLTTADAIEIKIGQGAKPGMGGHLLADKVTPDIARMRGIPLDTDAFSPCRHLDVAGLRDLEKQVKLLREVTRNEIPIIVKLGPADVYEDTMAAVSLGVDAVAIDGAEGGTGCAPDLVIEHAGVPTIGLFQPMRRALEDSGGRERGVKALVMGGIRHGADVVKSLALGADAVGMATACLIAMGCTGCRQCHVGRCRVGLASHDHPSPLDTDRASDSLVRFLQAITEEVRMLTALTGHNDIGSLSVEDVAALDWDAAAITGASLIGYGPVTGRG